MGLDDPSGIEKGFRRSFDSLSSIFVFIEQFFAAERLDRKNVSVVELVVEELFTNMVKYSPGSRHDILIGLGRDERRLFVRLTDFDVDRFNIKEVSEVRIDHPLAERKPGGLGIHLVKKLADRIDYEYADRTSRITFVKDLE